MKVRGIRTAAAVCLLVGVVAAAAVYVAQPSKSPGHFDNGEFSFDYPAEWRTMTAPLPTNGMPNPYRTEVVVGTGSWTLQCESTGYCGDDKVDVGGGRVVVKVARRVDGPASYCSYTPPSVPLAVRSFEAGRAIWTIRQPGTPYDYMGSVYLTVWTDGDAAESQVETLVASFRWNPQGSLPPPCSSGVPVARLGWTLAPAELRIGAALRRLPHIRYDSAHE